MNVVGWIIPAKIFHDGAEHGIKDQISRKNLAVKSFPAKQPREKKGKNQVQQRIVNFRWMQGNTKRRSRILFRLRVGEGDGPGQIARATITAAIQQATNP